MNTPFSTIYQNEDHVVIIFNVTPSKKAIREFPAIEISFKNSDCDGGACGFGLGSKEEVQKYLKENNFTKRGTIVLSDNYCRNFHRLNNNEKNTAGRCVLHKNHTGKHKGKIDISKIGESRKLKMVYWS